jgi:hypothetical protein
LRFCLLLADEPVPLAESIAPGDSSLLADCFTRGHLYYCATQNCHRELITRNGIDVWQPNLLRQGSVETWRDSAALAARTTSPCCRIITRSYDVPLLMTVPNIMGAKSFDWLDDLITSPLRHGRQV